MIYAIAIVSFLAGGFSYRFYLARKKKPKPAEIIIEIGNRVKVNETNLVATGIFLGWRLINHKDFNDGSQGFGIVRIDQDEKNLVWMVAPSKISYLSEGERSIKFEPKTFEN